MLDHEINQIRGFSSNRALIIQQQPLGGVDETQAQDEILPSRILSRPEGK
jgi:hypothetical protein